MMQATKDGTGDHTQMRWKPVPVVLEWSRQVRGRLRDTWPQRHMRTPVIVLLYPFFEYAS